jgi:hypothetical protein
MQEPEIARWTLIRDTLIFQVKLAMDAVRDLILSPVSIVCALIDIFKSHSLSQSYFRKLMVFGHQTDHWLNLFGSPNISNKTNTSNNPIKTSSNLAPITGQIPKPEVSVDQLFAQVEVLLKEQHGKGGLTASAKNTIDRYLNKIVENKK